MDGNWRPLHRFRASNRYPFWDPMSSILEQVGRVIGGRYRLLAVVGAGASAQVFAADDTRLVAASPSSSCIRRWPATPPSCGSSRPRRAWRPP